jgi:hypothetical protein
MKRNRTRRPKATPTRQPEPRKTKVRRHNPSSRDLPPNEKVDKYPDELYGDTEIPSR